MVYATYVLRRGIVPVTMNVTRRKLSDNYNWSTKKRPLSFSC